MDDPGRKAIQPNRRHDRPTGVGGTVLVVLMGVALAASACDGFVAPSGLGFQPAVRLAVARTIAKPARTFGTSDSRADPGTYPGAHGRADS